ncbi:hypothetical protein VTK56DRAFT_9363 [Thermocarpiscus australiensis]
MAARPKLRILCLGDSLTAGYSARGAVHHPYSEKMEQMLAMALPHLEIETVEDGVSGDLVKYGFLGRMSDHFRDEEKPYDWAIVLGGTNDLGFNIPPEEIFSKLKEVWDIPLRRSCKVLALTVPEAALTGSLRKRVDARRNELNNLIKGYKREGFHVFDLNKHVPYYSLSEEDKKKYWDDHLHFTPDGYDLIGNKVGNALVSLIVSERTGNSAPPRRPRMFKDDEQQFSEEEGDPIAIDRGYVVVRRADLD